MGLPEHLKPLVSSERSDWETPDSLFQEWNAKYKFTLDAAASKENAKCERFFTVEEDGLKQSWANEVVWVNPPYGRVPWNRKITWPDLWCAKASWESRYNGATVVMLLPARTDTRWWHDHVWDESKGTFREGVNAQFIKGRIKFQGAENGAPFPSVVVVFNPLKKTKAKVKAK